MTTWLVMRSNYVIDVIFWDGITPFSYPYPYDEIREDIQDVAGIGDWYEASEGVFYRPLTTPPDYPPA